MHFSGLYTAIVTPFTPDGGVDLNAFRTLIDLQLDGGVDGIVVGGSTGEAATMSLDEKRQLWDVAAQQVDGRVPIIAGSGSNDTRGTVEASVAAQQAGARALLVVTPYYNKPTRAGLIAHHQAIADASELPQILYNVPGRSALNMSAETQLAIVESCSTVVATKEASADLGQIAEIVRHAPEGFSVLAGDDNLALPIISVGGRGVIAVISNYAPQTYGALIRAALAGDLEQARSLQHQLSPWFEANFLESNPIPVKYLMHKKAGIHLSYRLPMTPPTVQTQATLDVMLSGMPQ